MSLSNSSSPIYSECDSDSSVEVMSPPREVDLPDEQRQARINEFVMVTEGSAQEATAYLVARNWDVVKAINGYFKDCRREEKRKRRVSRNYSSDDADDEQEKFQDDNSSSPVVKRAKKREKQARKSSNSFGETSSSSRTTTGVAAPNNARGDDKVELFRLITWNVDGIHLPNLSVRINAICDSVIKEKAIFVLLQEVTEAVEEIVVRRLSGLFHVFSGCDQVEYYTLILVAKRPYISVTSKDVIDFTNTAMGRNILQTKLTIYDNHICLLTAHLESTKEHASTRVEQLKELLKHCTDFARNYTVLVGGDLNLRDSELQGIGGLPCEIEDAWISTGRRKEVEYTWDMMRNDNLPFFSSCDNGAAGGGGGSGRRFKPRMRFDRIFMRESIPRRIEFVHFGLIGLERLKPNAQCFPSDHWGLIASFKIFHC